MVNPAATTTEEEIKYKGVRKRKWGKWVSEIRLPNSRERIWLGSYDSPEKAARAFDAALYCLRGPAARFNFPDDPPSPGFIGGGGSSSSMSPQEVQAVAARYAEDYQTRQGGGGGEEEGTRITTLLSPRAGNGKGNKGNYSNTSSYGGGFAGPAASSSTTTTTASDTTIDWSFLGMLNSDDQPVAAAASDSHFELFSGMDNMSMSMDMNMGGGDYYHDPHYMIMDHANYDGVISDHNHHHYHHDDHEMAWGDQANYSHRSSFLWNF